MKKQLEDKFPGQLEITGEATPNTSGWLEVRILCCTIVLPCPPILPFFVQVQIVEGALLHSKKNGDGYVDTSAKLEKIFAGVEAALK